jgi:hypothetical protein
MSITNNNIDISNLEKPLVISYDNEIKDETNRFITTLENNNWDYMIVGKGEKWYDFITKIVAYNTILKTLPDDKIVILSDARDVYCCRNPKKFIEEYNIFNGKTIVSTELFISGVLDSNKAKHFNKGVPVINYWNYHKITNLPNTKYVNSGLIAGKVSNLIEQTNWQISYAIKNNIRSDQLVLTHYINEFPDKIILDTDAIILHTSTFGVNAGIQNMHIQKQDSPTFAEFYGRSAFFLHIPGTMNKGQKEIYDMCWKFIKIGLNNESIVYSK